MSSPILLLRPELGRKPYRLRCRFMIEAFPSRESLDRAKIKAAELFIRAMKVREWEYVSRYGITLNPKPFIPIAAMNLDRPISLTARQMLPGVIRGNKYRAPVPSGVFTPPPLQESEAWEFELSAVFTHGTILTELADEEK